MTNAHWEVDHLARADLEALIHQHIVASVSQTPSTLKNLSVVQAFISKELCFIKGVLYPTLCKLLPHHVP